MALRQPITAKSDDDTTHITVALPADLVAAIEQAVRSGQAASPDQLMADALRHELAARDSTAGTRNGAPTQTDLLEGNVVSHRDEIAQRFRAGVEREVAEHLASDRPVFFSGTGSDAGKLFMRTPEGRRFEVRLAENDTHEVVRELPR